MFYFLYKQYKMPVKKTTRKTTTTRKPITKKPTAAKKATTTTKMSNDANCTSCRSSTNTRTILLLVANTVLLLFLISNYTVKQALIDMEAQRVWGIENYELIQQIYELDNFKEQQRFQIEQTLQALQGMWQEQPMMLPENIEIAPE